MDKFKFKDDVLGDVIAELLLGIRSDKIEDFENALHRLRQSVVFKLPGLISERAKFLTWKELPCLQAAINSEAPTRLKSLFLKIGSMTLGQLCRMTPDEFSKFKGAGIQTQRDCRSWLRSIKPDVSKMVMDTLLFDNTEPHTVRMPHIQYMYLCMFDE